MTGLIGFQELLNSSKRNEVTIPDTNFTKKAVVFQIFLVPHYLKTK
jgi:hypothetical protein